MKGYIKVPELSKDGKQHLHVLFRGSYIDQRLISAWWEEIHHAKIVDIRKVGWNCSKRKLASDMASYMSKENSFRYSWNWDWVWRGFCHDWKNVKRWCHELIANFKGYSFDWAITQWRLALKYGRPPQKPGILILLEENKSNA